MIPVSEITVLHDMSVHRIIKFTQYMHIANYRKKNLPITANAAETKLRWMITKHVGYLSLL